MEAQEQKQLQAKQSAVVFSQHHQIHLVCATAVRNSTLRSCKGNGIVKPACLIPSAVCPCRNEREEKKRSSGGRSGWTESGRKPWAD